MSNLIRVMSRIIRAFWEIAVLVPMPWRVSLVILVFILFSYYLGWRLLSWLIEKLSIGLLILMEKIVSVILLPEYWITKWLRQHKYKPLPGTYLFGDTLQGLVTLFHNWTETSADIRDRWRLRKSWFILLLMVSIPVFLWYIRSSLDDTTIVARYIDKATTWWASLEKQILKR
jgi:hypothetical protein